MFKRVKKTCFNTKALIIALIILVIIGFGLTVYLGIKMVNLKKEFREIGPREKLERIYSYVLVLDKFEKFKAEEGEKKTVVALEKAVLATDSGVLKNLFDEMIFSGNDEKDMNYFLDAIIDSLKLFSKQD